MWAPRPSKRRLGGGVVSEGVDRRPACDQLCALADDASPLDQITVRKRLEIAIERRRPAAAVTAQIHQRLDSVDIVGVEPAAD